MFAKDRLWMTAKYLYEHVSYLLSWCSECAGDGGEVRGARADKGGAEGAGAAQVMMMVMLLMVTAAIVRKEAIMIADRERRMKYKKQEEQRESVRQNLRDKVASFNVMSQ